MKGGEGGHGDVKGLRGKREGNNCMAQTSDRQAARAHNADFLTTSILTFSPSCPPKTRSASSRSCMSVRAQRGGREEEGAGARRLGKRMRKRIEPKERERE